MKTEVGPEMLFKDRLGILNIGLKFTIDGILNYIPTG